MSCFSLGWLEGLCVDLIIIAAIVAIIRLVVPWLLSLLGAGGIVAQIINIVLWAIVAIFAVYIVFGLLSCLVGGGATFHLLR